MSSSTLSAWPTARMQISARTKSSSGVASVTFKPVFSSRALSRSRFRASFAKHLWPCSRQCSRIFSSAVALSSACSSLKAAVRSSTCSCPTEEVVSVNPKTVFAALSARSLILLSLSERDTRSFTPRVYFPVHTSTGRNKRSVSVTDRHKVAYRLYDWGYCLVQFTQFYFTGVRGPPPHPPRFTKEGR